MHNIFIVDVDHTILNTDIMAKERVRLLAQYRPTTYSDVKQAIEMLRHADGSYTLEELVAFLLKEVPDADRKVSDVVEAVYALSYEDHFYPGAIEALSKLKQYGQILLYSQGQGRLQRAKVKRLVDLGLVSESEIYVYQNKVEATEDFVSALGKDILFVFDDHMRYLEVCKRCNPSMTTILVETQEKASDYKGPYPPSVSAATFASAVAIILEKLNG